jgi:hypothetical protein
MKSLSLSDRERAELRGPVKAIVDNWSTTVFDRDGKILEWRGNTSHGRSERTYFYDENGKLIRITGSDGDQVDEFRSTNKDGRRRSDTSPHDLSEEPGRSVSRSGSMPSLKARGLRTAELSRRHTTNAMSHSKRGSSMTRERYCFASCIFMAPTVGSARSG